MDMSNFTGTVRRFLGVCFCASIVLAAGAQQVMSQTSSAMSPSTASTDSLPIAPGDMVTIHVYDIPDMDEAHVRVTDTGEVPVLLLGEVKIAGLTPSQAGRVIANEYMRRNFLRAANVTVTLEDNSNSSVAVFGYVIGASATAGTKGITVPLSSAKPLLAVLAAAGGLADRASHTVTVQRRDLSTKPFTVFVPNDPSAALANQPLIYPGDILVVPRAGIVYILGDVGHPQAVVMDEDGGISMLEALTDAGSSLPSSSLSKVMIFRKADGKYHSLPVNVQDMVKGKAPDMQLMAEDVIYVPFSFGKNLMVNGASILAAVGSATASGIIYTH